MITYSFRPLFLSKLYKLKSKEKNQYHWHKRRLTNSHILRVGGQLHYLGSHAPLMVQNKWRKAEKRFCNLHRKTW